MNEFAQRLILKVRVLARYLVLRRQLAEIARQIDALSIADQRALLVHATRELQVSQRQSREAASTNTAFARARTDNPRVRLIGIAQWMTSAFRETEDSEHQELQNLHRQMMRSFRLLRQATGVVASSAA